MSTLTAKIQLRRDTAANWATNNPILAAGEVAFTSDLFYTSTDQQRFKIGDGVQTWSQLDYVPEGGGGTSYPETLYLTVVNKSGDNLLASDYKVMKVTDAQGQRLAVDFALADSNGNSTDTIGVVYENINTNQEGKLITVGEISEINTTGSLQGQTWVDGDVLYLDSATPGNLTNVQPTAPNHLVVMGYVVYAHANQGKIYVKIDNGYEIGELHDCYLPTPTNNDGIFWSSGTTRYENKSITQALGYTPFKLLAKNNTPITHTGTTDETLLLSYNLTGEFEANDLINIILYNAPLGSSVKTIRIKLNTSNSLVGATTIATYAPTTVSNTMERNIFFANTLSSIRIYNATTNYASDMLSQFTSNSINTINFSFTGNVWLLFSVQLDSSLGTIVINQLEVIRKR